MLAFEIPAVKCRHGVEVNWSRYRDTGVTDPALEITNIIKDAIFAQLQKFVPY